MKNNKSMKSLNYVLVLLAAYASVFSAPTFANVDTISMSVGNIEVLEVGEVIRIAVGNDEVITASVLESGHLMVIPLVQGSTDLIVWKTGERQERFKVNVLPTDMNESRALVESLMRNYDGIVARVVGDRVIVEGEVDPDEFDRIDNVLQGLPTVISLVKAMPKDKEMIQLKVQILELDKRYRKELGIDWADNANGPMVTTIGSLVTNKANYRVVPLEDNDIDWLSIGGLIPASDKTFYPFAGLATSVTSRINFIQENGAGRVLAEPTLSTRSGGTASFLAGGSIPYPFTDTDGFTTVQFQEYGIQLEIEPTVDSDGTIVSNIRAEVSSIDNAVSVLGVPGLLIRETESVVSIQPGETIAISGLLTTNDTRSIDSVPLLGELPILGKLFRSEEFQEQRTEIVFLVTSEIIDGKQSPAVSERVKKHLSEMQDVQGNGGVFDKLLAE